MVRGGVREMRTHVGGHFEGLVVVQGEAGQGRAVERACQGSMHRRWREQGSASGLGQILLLFVLMGTFVG